MGAETDFAKKLVEYARGLQSAYQQSSWVRPGLEYAANMPVVPSGNITRGDLADVAGELFAPAYGLYKDIDTMADELQSNRNRGLAAAGAVLNFLPGGRMTRKAVESVGSRALPYVMGAVGRNAPVMGVKRGDIFGMPEVTQVKSAQARRIGQRRRLRNAARQIENAPIYYPISQALSEDVDYLRGPFPMSPTPEMFSPIDNQLFVDNALRLAMR